MINTVLLNTDTSLLKVAELCHSVHWLPLPAWPGRIQMHACCYTETKGSKASALMRLQLLAFWTGGLPFRLGRQFCCLNMCV